MRLLTSRTAKADLARTLAWSGAQFGAPAQRRYRALIQQALRDIAANPRRLGVRDCSHFFEGLWSYHVRLSRRRSRGGRVRTPRHTIYFRILDPETVEVVRVLHDAMDAASRLAIETPE